MVKKNEEMPQGFNELPFFMQKYLTVRPWCRTDAEAAHRVGINRRSIYAWRGKSQAFAECEEYFKQAGLEDCRQEFDSLTPDAVKMYRRVMDSEDMRAGLSAARDVLQEKRILTKEAPQQTRYILALPFERKEIDATTDYRLIEGVSTPQRGATSSAQLEEENKGS